PHRPVTRAEFAVMLTQCGALLPAGAGSTGGSARFADVSGKHWAFNAIQTVTGQGWMSGYPHAHFRPNQDISTPEVYAILARRSAAPPLSGAEAEA
ncbi:S-layer homology domain-containing protein, partial [Streptomyces scabiei]